MRVHRLLSGLTMLGLAFVAASSLKGAAFTTLLIPPGDPEAGHPFEWTQPSALAFDHAGGCQLIGGGDQRLSAATFRYRGNVLRMNRTVELQELLFELDFTGTAELSFSVHEAEPPSNEFKSKYIGPIRTTPGAGRRFYSSGIINPAVQLGAGKDYVLAVTWGNTNIAYFRDQQQYPLPFTDGSVQGQVGTTIPAGPPLDPNTSLFFTPFTGGAYSMDMCFVRRTGACCAGDGTCSNVLESACAGLFRGDGTNCATIDPPCNVGACCTALTCELISRSACAAAGGLWRGFGTDCASGLCSPTGGCCTGVVPNAVCEDGLEEITQADCESGGGTYQGNWTTCDIQPSCGNGACCSPNFGCVDNVPQQVCVGSPELQGTFRGAGTTCERLDPQCPGTCCYNITPTIPGCVTNVTPANCRGLTNGVFLGVGVACGSGVCPSVNPVAACCLPNGTCTRTDQNGCDDLRGTFQAGSSTCTGVNCAGFSACCLPNGLCSEIGAVECANQGGQYHAGTPCSLEICSTGACCTDDGATCSNLSFDACRAQMGNYYSNEVCQGAACPAATGACCLPNQTCAVLTEAGCLNNAGRYNGDGTACTGGSQCTPGACCLPGGGCEDTVSAPCLNRGGLFNLGSICTVVSCPPTGACCVGQECTELIFDACDGSGGNYQGDQTTCTAALCAVGACCAPDGTCSEINRSACDFISGNFAVGALCADTVCPPTGACCVNNSCQQISQGACDAAGGLFSGDATTCASGLCTPSACCRNGICTELTEPACVADGGTWVGAGATCATTGCNEGSCCHIDAACDDDVLIGQCAAPSQFREGETCAALLCEARGACCNSDGTCSVTAGAACTGFGQVYLGDGVDCGVDVCPAAGACCAPDRTCEVLIGSFCASLGRSYGGDGSTCAADTCVNGACCQSPDGCTETDEFACLAGGGFFTERGTTCPDGVCDRGSCCEQTGVCTDDVVAYQCMDVGTIRVGETCQSIPCVPVGACCLPGGGCQFGTPGECVIAGGEFQGGGIACDVDACSPGACCTGTSCTVGTRGNCLTLGGSFQGHGLTCTPGLCTIGACCAVGQCTDETATLCALAGGSYQGDGVACATDTCTLGACCELGVCSEETVLDCTAHGGVFMGLATTCSAGTCDVGACCLPDESCQVIDQSACQGQGGVYEGDATMCTTGLCDIGACCIDGLPCTEGTAGQCAAANGAFQGSGITCMPNPCAAPSIVSSTPASGNIDARQPHDINNTALRFGWDSVGLVFDGNVAGMSTADFALTEVGDDGVAPNVLSVAPSATDALTVTFDRPIDPAAWTVVTHLGSGTEICLGYLPGDVNGSRGSTAADINALINSLNNVPGFVRPVFATDANRSGAANASDILRVIDLLNGAAAFDPWLNKTIPVSPCN